MGRWSCAGQCRHSRRGLRRQHPAHSGHGRELEHSLAHLQQRCRGVHARLNRKLHPHDSNRRYHEQQQQHRDDQQRHYFGCGPNLERCFRQSCLWRQRRQRRLSPHDRWEFEYERERDHQRHRWPNEKWNGQAHPHRRGQLFGRDHGQRGLLEHSKCNRPGDDRGRHHRFKRRDPAITRRNYGGDGDTEYQWNWRQRPEWRARQREWNQQLWRITHIGGRNNFLFRQRHTEPNEHGDNYGRNIWTHADWRRQWQHLEHYRNYQRHTREERQRHLDTNRRQHLHRSDHNQRGSFEHSKCQRPWDNSRRNNGQQRCGSSNPGRHRGWCGGADPERQRRFERWCHSQHQRKQQHERLGYARLGYNDCIRCRHVDP